MFADMGDANRPGGKRLVIHAGLGKSGSSAIQRYCRDHPQELRRAGALYLGTHLERAEPSPLDFASVEALHDALPTPEAEDRLVALLTAKIASRPGIRTFVWSQIALAVQAPLLGRVIARLAPLCETEVLLYFRHQADWLVSAYLQWGVKHKTDPGPILPFADWIPQAASRGADYRAVIERWIAAVGRDRLHLRAYDAAADVVADFVSVARLGAKAEDDGRTRQYETPDPMVMMLFRLLNGQRDAPAPPGALYRLIAESGLERRRYREVDPASTLPSGADWARFAATFDDGNAGLARDFGLTLSPAGPGPAPDPVHPAPAAAIPALLDLILAMDRRIGALEQQLKRKG